MRSFLTLEALLIHVFICSKGKQNIVASATLHALMIRMTKVGNRRQGEVATSQISSSTVPHFRGCGGWRRLLNYGYMWRNIGAGRNPSDCCSQQVRTAAKRGTHRHHATWAGRALRLLLAAGAYRSEARNAPTPCDLGWSRASLAARSRCVPQRSEERTDTMQPGPRGWARMKRVQKDPRLSAYIRSFIFQAW
jgi:hypothetical protein